MICGIEIVKLRNLFAPAAPAAGIPLWEKFETTTC